jgi:hypothetical protein
MISWRDAYQRLRFSPEFRRYFGQGKLLPAYAFRPIVYPQRIIVGAAASAPPTAQNFPAGAVILGITSAAYQAQTATGAFTYEPWATEGRRDLYALQFQYSGDEQIVAGATLNADALLGSGGGTQFPPREILMPPSQALLATVQNFTVAPDLTVDIGYHCMVPRVVG